MKEEVIALSHKQWKIYGIGKQRLSAHIIFLKWTIKDCTEECFVLDCLHDSMSITSWESRVSQWLQNKRCALVTARIRKWGKKHFQEEILKEQTFFNCLNHKLHAGSILFSHIIFVSFTAGVTLRVETLDCRSSSSSALVNQARSTGHVHFLSVSSFVTSLFRWSYAEADVTTIVIFKYWSSSSAQTRCHRLVVSGQELRISDSSVSLVEKSQPNQNQQNWTHPAPWNGEDRIIQCKSTRAVDSSINYRQAQC